MKYSTVYQDCVFFSHDLPTVEKVAGKKSLMVAKEIGWDVRLRIGKRVNIVLTVRGEGLQCAWTPCTLDWETCYATVLAATYNADGNNFDSIMAAILRWAVRGTHPEIRDVLSKYDENAWNLYECAFKMKSK